VIHGDDAAGDLAAAQVVYRQHRRPLILVCKEGEAAGFAWRMTRTTSGGIWVTLLRVAFDRHGARSGASQEPATPSVFTGTFYGCSGLRANRRRARISFGTASCGRARGGGDTSTEH
jgi:hypothetical protein